MNPGISDTFPVGTTTGADFDDAILSRFGCNEIVGMPQYGGGGGSLEEYSEEAKNSANRGLMSSDMSGNERKRRYSITNMVTNKAHFLLDL